MKIIDCAVQDWEGHFDTQAAPRDSELEFLVSEIIEDVRIRGDEALLEHARKFDSSALASIHVSASEMENAEIPAPQAVALERAFERIVNFHRNQVEVLTAGMQRNGREWNWRMYNQQIGQRMRPLGTAGLYVPGGRAAYPSSVLMLAGPALAAGVDRLYVTSPSMVDGSLHPAVLHALKVAGVKGAFKIGGASAVAAFAFGTESVPKVDKVAGPGNKFVNEAKRQLWGTVGVDGQYGPSEVCVVIDASSNPVFAAADLLTQIEHAPDNLGYLVSFGNNPLDRALLEVEKQVSAAPRKEIFHESLKHVKAFVVNSVNQAAEIIDRIAPEHLTISVQDPTELLDQINHAGCILLGDWTPESVADYCLGPCHTLPTGGASRFSNPLSSLDFLKLQSVARLNREEASELAEIAVAIAEAEGFPAHGFGASVRV